MWRTCRSMDSRSTSRRAKRATDRVSSRRARREPAQPQDDAPPSPAERATRSAQRQRRRHRSAGHRRRAPGHHPDRKRQDAESLGHSPSADARSRRSRRPWPFQATLTNGVPPGEIDVNGNFGPWHRDEPGDTPLTASSISRTPTSAFSTGIKGTLSSDGYFGGTLAEIRANGTSNTPDFTLQVAGHPFPLWVVYQALDRRHQRRHPPRIDRRVVPELVPARQGRGARFAEGQGRAHGNARCRDDAVAHRGHHDDGGESAEAADDRRADA